MGVYIYASGDGVDLIEDQKLMSSYKERLIEMILAEQGASRDYESVAMYGLDCSVSDVEKVLEVLAPSLPDVNMWALFLFLIRARRIGITQLTIG